MADENFANKFTFNQAARSVNILTFRGHGVGPQTPKHYDVEIVFLDGIAEVVSAQIVK